MLLFANLLSNIHSLIYKFEIHNCSKSKFLSTSLFGMCLFFVFICWKSRIDCAHDWKHPTIRISFQNREIFPVYRVRTPGPGLSASVGTGAALGVQCIKLMNSWQLRIAAWCGWYQWCLVIPVTFETLPQAHFPSRTEKMYTFHEKT